MKLIQCCLLAALVAVSQAGIDVEKTVKQVQTILQANQQLPRLNREEILQLLNDIRSEDSKIRSVTESKDEDDVEKIPLQYNSFLNEINSPNIIDNIVDEDFTDTIISTTEDSKVSATSTPNRAPNSVSIQNLYPSISKISKSNSSNNLQRTTTSKPNLVVVLPYTPRDGSSLQELYTRPPRLEAVHVSSTSKPDTKKRINKYPANLQNRATLPPQLTENFPAELQSFLEAHGLKGKPGQDHFLLPLEGFKPLPPAKEVDGTVELPENILLTYDLIAPSTNSKTKSDTYTNNNFLYAPLRPELPFDLEALASEIKEENLPYDMPVKKLKSSPNYEPIDYDSIRVIPLNKEINPLFEQINNSNEQAKRQVSIEVASSTSTTTEEPKTNVVSAVASADADTGASISDLEASFGGAAPAQPGDSQLPPPKKNGFYWMLDWNSFLEVGDGDTKVNIRFEPKLGDPQMFLPVTVP